MKSLFTKVRGIVTRPRVAHYIDIFAAATGMALWYQRDNLLGAHGLNAVGCVVFGASVAGGKAVLEAYRKSVPATPPSK